MHKLREFNTRRQVILQASKHGEVDAAYNYRESRSKQIFKLFLKRMIKTRMRNKGCQSVII